MDALIFIAGLALFILQIVILVKFFGLCSDVKDIKKNQNRSTFRNLNVTNAKLSKLVGCEDEMYNDIVQTLIRRLNDNNCMTSVKKDYIKLAKQLCEILGKELPEQLKSIEAFDNYIESDKQ